MFGKDESKQLLLIATSEMISLPKKSIKAYMSTPLKTLKSSDTLQDALLLFNRDRIHGAPIVDNGRLAGIITISDIAKAVERELPYVNKSFRGHDRRCR